MPDPRLPTFIIAGAAKSATTWLQQSLQGCDGIVMPDPEPHYFSREYHRGQAFYTDMFAHAKAGAIIGEKSNSYLTTPEADQRIRKDIPHVRLVFQLRNPVDRAYSDYLMLFRRGEVDDDITRHLDPDRAAQGRFLADGRYGDHLQRFYDLFGAEQILVLLYESMTRDSGQQLRRLADHIGVPDGLAPPLQKRVKDAGAAAVPRPLRRMLAPIRPILDPIRNTAMMQRLRGIVARPHVYPKLDPSLKAEIADYFRPQIDKVEALTRACVDDWRPKPQI